MGSILRQFKRGNSAQQSVAKQSEARVEPSRRTGLCTIAPADADVGCDLGKVESHSAHFLEDYFTADEQNLVARTPPGMRDHLLTMLRSAKESALKALCCGLRMDTRSVHAAPVDDPRTRDEEWRRVSVAHINGRSYHGWWRESHDLVCTVVADPPPRRPTDRATP